MSKAGVLAIATFLLSASHLRADESGFDIGAYQKRPYQLTGFIEANLDHQLIAADHYATRLFFPTQPVMDSVTERSATLELSADYHYQHWTGRATVHGEADDSELGHDQRADAYEALLAYQPTPGMTLELGKKALKWGKGYAWNPVGFVERPKNPDDPELAREGYVLATADIIKSGSGDLRTLAFTPVYLPVSGSLNDDYGAADHANLALKVYALYQDTDIDILYLDEGSQSRRYGFDFSRNLSTNVELHGEWAYISELTRARVTSNGVVSSEQVSASQWLLGLRYLTENETTLIAEYYRNEGGYTSAELEDYFVALDAAFASNNSSLLDTLASIGSRSYLLRNPSRDYFYLRLSNKEPFDWLYFTPALTLISNLQDHSYSLSPEFVYSGMDNLELRLKATLLDGAQYSEFGEKRNRQRYELRLRYFF